MTISVGETLPDATLTVMGAGGVEQVSMATYFRGRKVVIFGLPGAFTGTCSTSHLPSFMRVREKLAAKGVDDVICVSVNDAWVMKAWGEATGATRAGITLLGDANSEFTKAIGMNYSSPKVGFIERSRRYALYAEDGVVKVLNAGQETSACEISGGENMLAAI